MKDNRTPDEIVTANAAEAADENNDVAAGLKKFKSVQALIEAYQALEAEFTRRSQRLKELEANKGKEAPAEAANAESPSHKAANDTAGEAETLPQEVRNAVIAEYLNGVYANRGVPFLTGGGAVVTERRTPSTLREAGALAKNYLENKEDR